MTDRLHWSHPGPNYLKGEKMSKATYQILEEAQNLIKNEACWTQGSQARDRLGREIDPCEPQAVRWCAIGAVRAVAGKDSDIKASIALLSAATPNKEECYPMTWDNDLEIVEEYNDLDYRKHSEIIILFDKAIMEIS